MLPYKSSYEGTWKEGKPHGSGKLKFLSSGATYEGRFKEGLPHGYVCFLGVNGCYKGQWLFGEMHGDGKFIWQDGSRYNGEWKSGFFSGLGTLSWPFLRSTIEFTGYWKDGEPVGKGLFTLPGDIKLSFDWDRVKSSNGPQDYSWSCKGTTFYVNLENGKPRGNSAFVLTNDPKGKFHIYWDQIIVGRKKLSVHKGDLVLGNGSICESFPTRKAFCSSPFFRTKGVDGREEVGIEPCSPTGSKSHGTTQLTGLGVGYCSPSHMAKLLNSKELLVSEFACLGRRPSETFNIRIGDGRSLEVFPTHKAYFSPSHMAKLLNSEELLVSEFACPPPTPTQPIINHPSPPIELPKLSLCDRHPSKTFNIRIL